MKRAETTIVFGLLACSLFATTSAGADGPAFDRKEDVIYGRKFGTALTMDVFTPKSKSNGGGHRVRGQRRVSFVARSDQSGLLPPFARPRLHRLRRRARQPASFHRPRDHPGYE